jgi:hypothetical protein
MHTAEASLKDIRRFRSIASCNATLLIDDINEGPGDALAEAESEGIIEGVTRHMFDGPHMCSQNKFGKKRCGWKWGFAVARYKRSPMCDA